MCVLMDVFYPIATPYQPLFKTCRDHVSNVLFHILRVLSLAFPISGIAVDKSELKFFFPYATYFNKKFTF